MSGKGDVSSASSVDFSRRDVRAVMCYDLHSPGRVAADTVTSARSDSLDHDSRLPGVSQRHQAYPCLRYTRDELLSFDGRYVCSAQLAERVHQLGLAPGGHRCRRPARKRPYRGGRSKQGRTIPVIISERPASQSRTLRPLTTPTFDSARRLSVECDTNSDNAICYSNLIKINTSLFTQKLFRHFKVMFLNTQSVRNKTTDICDHVMHANVDLIFLCETWLRREGDESDCVALTAPGFCLRSFPRMSGAGYSIAVLYRNSLTKKKKKKNKQTNKQKHCSFHQRFCFYCI